MGELNLIPKECPGCSTEVEDMKIPTPVDSDGEVEASLVAMIVPCGHWIDLDTMTLANEEEAGLISGEIEVNNTKQPRTPSINQVS